MNKISKWILEVFGLVTMFLAVFSFIINSVELVKSDSLDGLFMIVGMGGLLSLFMLPFIFFGSSVLNFILGYSFWRLRKWSIVLGSIYLIYQASYIFLDPVSFKENIFNSEYSAIMIFNFFINILVPLIILILAIPQRKYLSKKYYSVFPLIIAIVIIFINLDSSGLINVPLNATDFKYSSVEKELSNYSRSEKILSSELGESDCAGFAVNFSGEDNIEDRIKSYKSFLGNSPEYQYTHCYTNKGEFVFVTKLENAYDDYMNTTTVYKIKDDRPKKITDFHTQEFKIFENKNDFYFAHRNLGDNFVWVVYVFDENKNDFLLMDKFESEGAKICRQDICYYLELIDPKRVENIIKK